MTAGLLSGCRNDERSRTESPAIAKARQYAELKISPNWREKFVENAAEIEREYTTASVRSQVLDRVYEVPANYYTTAGKTFFKRFAVEGGDRYEIPGVGNTLFTLHFFWPDFGGYTTDNWHEGPGDRRLITYRIFELYPPTTKQKTTDEQIEFLRSLGTIESEPSVELHGLRGHRWHNSHDYVWVGQRASGERFKMRSARPDRPDGYKRVPYPRCVVSMYDGTLREEATYDYSLDLFKHWREIDSRTDAAIKSWRRE